MPKDDNGNGKQRQINGLTREDEKINIKLDLLQSSIEDVHKIVVDFLAPGGICDRHRQLGAVSKNRLDSHDKWLGVIIALLVTLVGLSVKAAFFG